MNQETPVCSHFFLFAILFEGLLIEIQEEIHYFAVLGERGLMGAKIANKHFVNKLAFPNEIKAQVKNIVATTGSEIRGSQS